MKRKPDNPKAGRPASVHAPDDVLHLVNRLRITERHARRLLSQWGSIERVIEWHELNLRKINLQNRRLQFDLSVTDGDFLLRAAVHAAGMRAGAMLAAMLEAWASNLPGQIEGLKTTAIRALLAEESKRINRTLAAALP
jgi:hypothetical protein